MAFESQWIRFPTLFRASRFSLLFLRITSMVLHFSIHAHFGATNLRHPRPPPPSTLLISAKLSTSSPVRFHFSRAMQIPFQIILKSGSIKSENKSSLFTLQSCWRFSRELRFRRTFENPLKLFGDAVKNLKWTFFSEHFWRNVRLNRLFPNHHLLV